jgi:hypothetical protein
MTNSFSGRKISLPPYISIPDRPIKAITIKNPGAHLKTENDRYDPDTLGIRTGKKEKNNMESITAIMTA